MCVAPRLRNSRSFPSPATTATSSDASRHRREPQTRLALLGLVMHVRDLDPLEHAARGPEAERGPGIVGVDVHLQGGLVTDDHQRVAEPLEFRLQ